MEKKLILTMIWILMLGAVSTRAQQPPIRINVGGPAYTDSKGQVWSADRAFNTGNLSGCAPGAIVTGTSDPQLYKSARWGGTGSPEMQYTFAVPNGSYTVNLYFAEACANVPPGVRVFDVELQGAKVFASMDISQIAGRLHALVKSANVSVRQGQLTIRFVHRKDNPIVNAIEILPASSTAPAITSQPLSETVAPGLKATFSVTASGTAPLRYQWKKNGVAISGATSAGYTTPVTTAADNGMQFTAVVSNGAGTATSKIAVLLVKAPVNSPVAPSISVNPTSQTVAAGLKATFSVTASGTAPLSYQWQRGGTAISGATASAYTTAATTSSDNGAQFRVVVSNSKGNVISNSATLTVNSAVAPSISVNPTSQTVAAGLKATFSVTASGTAPLSYQWQRGGTAISGATASAYTTAATTSSDNGAQFRVVVSNSKGNVISNSATLTVNSAVAPSISVNPTSQAVAAGLKATFSVTASGTAPLSYQWQRGGTAISGATASAYTTAATTSSDNGAQFRVVVSNSKGNVISNSATLTVNSAVAPSISAHPASQTVTAGETATFSVTASGTSPLTYQWRKNGSAINGAASAIYTTPPATSADNGAQFAANVSNTMGSLTSNAATLTVNAVSAAVDVVTYHNDNGRTGQNLKETILTQAKVNQNTFGLHKVVTLDGKVDAQPLFLSGVAIAGQGTHDVVYAATEHDSVYALDAVTGAILWHVSTLANGETTSDTHGCDQVSPEIGITSTPVIDRTRGPHGAIYVVAMSKNNNGSYFQRLYAFDVTSGAQLFGGPHTITGSYPGTGDHNSGGNVIFDPGQYKERAGLLLMGGKIYTTWASHCDFRPYTGWIMSFDAGTLAAVSVLNLTPNGTHGALWMSGAAPAADTSGNIYVLDGDGTFDTTLLNGFPSKGDFGNCFCKISTSSGLKVADYFAVSNTVSESNADTDLGSGAALVLPDLSDGAGNTLHLAVGAGKDGNIYVVNRDNMGKFDPNGNHIHQQLTGEIAGVWSMAAYFNNTVFYAAVNDVLKAFTITNGKLSGSPTSRAPNTLGYPGATPSISANGQTNGIVWTVGNSSPAVLDAYDAADVSHQLYHSNQAANSRDHFGNGNKYMTPTIAKGHVYVGTPNGIAIFGLLP